MYLLKEGHWRHVPVDYQDMLILAAYFTPTQDATSVRKKGRENMRCMYIKEGLIRKQQL